MKTRADDDIGDYWEWYNPPQYTIETDAILVQPVGFVWFSKIRVRVKAISRKREVGES